MRALSVRQPWAWAIIFGGKDVENRTRNIAGSYRGPVAIHSPITEDTRSLGDPRILAAMAANPTAADTPSGHALWLRGVFLGVADLTDVHDGFACSHHVPGELCSPWAEPGVWHLRLTNPRPLAREIPYPGRLGLWTPPNHLLDQLQGATP